MGSGGSRSLLPPGRLVGQILAGALLVSATVAAQAQLLQSGICPELNNNLDKFLMSRVFFVSHYMLLTHILFAKVFVASQPPKAFWCYMAKPHGQLVLVSFTHYCASTPSLSTS